MRLLGPTAYRPVALTLRHVFRGISVYYLEAAILVYRNTWYIDQNMPCITCKFIIAYISI